MNIEDIYDFFRNPQPTFLNQELAVCYVLHTLLQGDTYGTELILRLEQEYPGYKLSDTVLYVALNFLEREHFILSYLKKLETRGRPRRMLKINLTNLDLAEELAQLWQGYIAQRQKLLSSKTYCLADALS